MKEYKVIVPKIGFRNRVQNFEDILNQYAREGWVVNHIAQSWGSIVLNEIKIDKMNTNRPKLIIPYQTIDIVIELASIAVLILMWTQLIMEYSSLPDTVASHFNGAGQPDGYSSKTFLWFLPILGIVLYIGLLILSRFPHLHNYMVNITAENAFRQYRFSIRILRVVNFLCVFMFAYINYKIIVGAQNNASELGMGFVITVVSVSILLPIIIFIYQKN